MKTIKGITLISFLISICLVPACTSSQVSDSCPGGHTYYFGVEIDGILCGHSVEQVCPLEKDGRQILDQSADVTVKLSILGTGMDILFRIHAGVDPATEKLLFYESSIRQGNASIQSVSTVKGDTVFYTGNSSPGIKKIPLSSDIILEIPMRSPHLLRDFIRGGEKERTYRVYEPIRGEIIEKGYRWIGEEELAFGDSVFNTMVLEEKDLSSMTRSKIWLNKEDGFQVKVLVAGRHIYLADASVMKKIKVIDLDNVIFARVNKVIPDFQQMTYLKVQARIQGQGGEVTAESLNRPGQVFTGTVADNFIDGTFELQPVRYDGNHAPPFPADYRGIPEIQKYLKPEILIESDHPDILNESQKITQGATDSWDAAVRLSKWVAHNIRGAIPGGGSAINTYNMREAECGGHSRLLAAFCRAVGIPARLSIGCVYTSHHGGSFGQHGWTEVYLGEAGWIPVDATFFEYDYIDAGHLWLGEKTTFQPEEMQILDYQIIQNH
jgi:hypothetical protein